MTITTNVYLLNSRYLVYYGAGARGVYLYPAGTATRRPALRRVRTAVQMSTAWSHFIHHHNIIIIHLWLQTDESKIKLAQYDYLNFI